MLPRHLDHNLGVLARVPLASGFLSGKYRKGLMFAENDHRSRGNEAVEERAKMLDEVERIRQEEVPAGVPMSEWALAWCLRHPAVHSVIPGCKTPEQVEANARAAELLEN